MKNIVGIALLVAGAQAFPAFAQDTPVVAQAAPVVATPMASAAAGSQIMLPSNTEVIVSMNEELNSKKFKKDGHTFMLSVANDVRVGDYVVVPKGAPAFGVVTWRTGKGAFGKSAKMEFDITHVDLNGRRIPLKGHFRQEGKGNTGAAVGAVVAVGVFGAFVTGKSAIVEQGREFKVYTTEPLPVVLGAK